MEENNNIKDLAIITYYTEGVDYLRKRQEDDDKPKTFVFKNLGKYQCTRRNMYLIFHEIVDHLHCVVVYPIDKTCYVSMFITTNDKILQQVSCGMKIHHAVPIIFFSLTQIINILYILCDNGEVLYIVIFLHCETT